MAVVVVGLRLTEELALPERLVVQVVVVGLLQAAQQLLVVLEIRLAHLQAKVALVVQQQEAVMTKVVEAVVVRLLLVGMVQV